jgi:hypothetical protein
MKKAVWLAFILSCVSLAWAQKKISRPNLSGAWALDKSKSKLGQLNQGRLAGADLKLMIEHSDPQIKALYRFSLNGQEFLWHRVLYSDGRGEVNSGIFGGGNQVRSETRWEGAYLVSRARMDGRGDDLRAVALERWGLSAKGKMLTITISMRGQTARLVFTRQQ